MGISTVSMTTIRRVLSIYSIRMSPEKRLKLFHPPYPIVSSEELYVIWKKLRYQPELCDPPEILLLEFQF